MGRYRFLARRLLQLIPLLLGIVLLVFLLLKVTPGDPARLILGARATPEQIAGLNEELGLNDPVPVQYLTYLGDVVTGDLGDSVRQRIAVSDIIKERLPVTVWLVALGSLVSLLIAVPLALLASRKPDGAADHGVRIFSTVTLTMPPFWVGILLIAFVALPTGAFPVAGYGDTFAEHLRSLALPALTLGIALAPVQIRSLRAALVDVRRAEYVAMARSVGVGRRRVALHYELKNAVLPMITILTVAIGYSLFGAVIIEQTFGLPGLGQGMLTAVSQRDFPVVQGITLVFALIVVAVQIASDVLYTLIDPRVEIR